MDLFASAPARQQIKYLLISLSLGNLMFIFLSGLPFLSILQFLGGIDPTLIVAYAATTAIGLVSMSCLCMLNSVLNRKSRDAIAVSYFCILGYLILSGASWGLLSHVLSISWISPTMLEKALYVGSAGNPRLPSRASVPT